MTEPVLATGHITSARYKYLEERIEAPFAISMISVHKPRVVPLLPHLGGRGRGWLIRRSRCVGVAGGVGIFLREDARSFTHGKYLPIPDRSLSE